MILPSNILSGGMGWKLSTVSFWKRKKSKVFPVNALKAYSDIEV
jgi:hypothetical protein